MKNRSPVTHGRNGFERCFWGEIRNGSFVHHRPETGPLFGVRCRVSLGVIFATPTNRKVTDLSALILVDLDVEVVEQERLAKS
jgi:hypothetical protein